MMSGHAVSFPLMLLLLGACASPVAPPALPVVAVAADVDPAAFEPAPLARADAMESACARPARPQLVTTRLLQGDRSWPGAPTGSEMNSVVAETHTYSERNACP